MCLRIEGRVQGVGFRDFVMHEAGARKLPGWVRNRSDDSVEVLVSGAKAEVEALIAACQRGPAAAQVNHCDLSPTEPPDTVGIIRRPTF